MPLVTDARVFLAVLPDAPLRRALERLRRRLLPAEDPGWRLVPAQDLHLTLRFFGNLPPPGADPALPWRARLIEACATLALRHGPLETCGEDLTVWRTRGPRPLVLRFAPTAALQQLASGAETLARELGFPAERRAWQPHITLARATARAGPLRLANPDCSKLPPLRIAALALLRSRPQPAANRYEVIWRRPFEG